MSEVDKFLDSHRYFMDNVSYEHRGGQFAASFNDLVKLAKRIEHRQNELLAALKLISSSACQERGNAIELKEIADDAIAKAGGKS